MPLTPTLPVPGGWGCLEGRAWSRAAGRGLGRASRALREKAGSGWVSTLSTAFLQEGLPKVGHLGSLVAHPALTHPSLAASPASHRAMQKGLWPAFSWYEVLGFDPPIEGKIRPKAEERRDDSPAAVLPQERTLRPEGVAPRSSPSKAQIPGLRSCLAADLCRPSCCAGSGRERTLPAL